MIHSQSRSRSRSPSRSRSSRSPSPSRSRSPRGKTREVFSTLMKIISKTRNIPTIMKNAKFQSKSSGMKLTHKFIDLRPTIFLPLQILKTPKRPKMKLTFGSISSKSKKKMTKSKKKIVRHVENKGDVSYETLNLDNDDVKKLQVSSDETMSNKRSKTLTVIKLKDIINDINEQDENANLSSRGKKFEIATTIIDYLR